MSSCGPCATLVVAGLAAWGSLRAMRIHTMVTALSALLASACTSIVVDVDPSEGGAAGEVSEGSSEGGSTGLGGSETGAPGGTGATEDSGGSTSSTGGEASTTTGEGSSTGDPGTTTGGLVECALVLFYPNDIPRCECDGAPVDPAQCGCSFTENGCECDGVLHEEMTCGWPCQLAGPDLCVCGNFPADVEFCEL